ncbi:hypothetical protein NQ317_009643 [Molorchus minor]|uniref:Uncharacterized protein n=1 Tax=Molorchus minor TaxID=1323400 RepID=A0ABQ9JYF3_9CUCU|nr:hypothetical protein NQ317_009643 [Molorchus minor]
MYAHNPAYNSSSINRIVDNLQKGVSNVDVYKPTLPQAWNAGSSPKPQHFSSSTLPRSKPKPPLSPSYKPSVIPPVFIPKESSTPLPNLNTPTYNAQQGYLPHQPYQPILQVQNDYISPQIPSPRKISYSQNYNTAPRGWGQIKDSYKPVTFDKPKESYSDF